MRCSSAPALWPLVLQVDALEFYPAVLQHGLAELLQQQQAALHLLPRPAAVVTFRWVGGAQEVQQQLGGEQGCSGALCDATMGKHMIPETQQAVCCHGSRPSS